MHHIIGFFCNRHLLVNLITILVLVGGLITYGITNKEELPDITFNTIYISTAYPGASAQDVEFYVTKPLEEAIQGLDGIRLLSSTTQVGQSRLSVELENHVKNIDEVMTEMQNRISTVTLPDAVLNDPQIRVFETSKKAIIDIALYDEDRPILDVESRQRLQRFARGLENQLVSAPEVFEIRRSGYLVEEIMININAPQVKPL